MKFITTAAVILTFGVILNAQQSGEAEKSGQAKKSADAIVIQPTEEPEMIIVEEDFVPSGEGVSGSAPAAKKEAANPVETKPAAAAKPAEPKKEAVKPAETKPVAAAKPAEAKTEAAKPAEVKPAAAAAKPAEPKKETAKSAAAAKPAEAKPAAAAAKPAEAKKETAKPAAAAKPAEPKKEAVKPAAAAKPAEAKPAAAAKPAEPKKETAKPAETPAAAVPPAADEIIPVSGGFIVGKKHSVATGDTLWDLSRKYYSDPFKWGKIYNANAAAVMNPDRIYPKEELVIPGVDEEVLPEQDLAETAEAAQEELIEASRAGEAAPAAAVPPAAAMPALSAAKPGEGTLSEQLPVFDADALSEEMPEDMKEWQTSGKIVPDSWTESGVITAKESSDDNEYGLAFSGEVVYVQVYDPSIFRPGDTMNCYLKGSVAYDKKGGRLGRELQKIGLLEVISLEGNTMKARVLDATTSINKGQVVKKKKAEPKSQETRRELREVTITAPRP